MYRGVWWATVHGAAKSQTLLKRLSTDSHFLSRINIVLIWIYGAVESYRDPAEVKIEGVEAKHSRFNMVTSYKQLRKEKHKARKPGLGFEFQSCLLLPVELELILPVEWSDLAFLRSPFLF